jgi:hypothetical protein
MPSLPISVSLPPSRRQRIAAAVALSVIFATGAVAFTTRAEAGPSDFSQLWAGARAAVGGTNPYPLIGPGRPVYFFTPLSYPLPGVLSVTPLGILPLHLAEFTFVALGFGLTAYLLTARAWYPLLTLASWPAVAAALIVQWPPLLLAAATVPMLAWLTFAKPTVGLAYAFYQPTTAWLKSAVIGSACLLTLSFLLVPEWVGAWAANLREVPTADMGGSVLSDLYDLPLRRPAAFVVLLAASRWRRPEARLLLVLTCVPQTMYGHELLPIVALVPRRPFETALLTAGSWLVAIAYFDTRRSGTQLASLEHAGSVSVWAVLIPATFFVLTRRNEGTLPSWASSGIALLRSARQRFP